MFQKILIANRGEIACRIIGTARSMGIATVAVYSDADRYGMHVTMADQAVRLGTGPATDSYLVIERVIKAARDTGAEAIHPGYGFLAENPDFAGACVAAGISFIGPSPQAMRSLGGKAEAKDIAAKAGVPIVPGYQGKSQKPETLAREAARVGYPVMIKAVSGGGGRGMRLVEQPEAFGAALESATREALSAFGDASVLIEKRVLDPRHIEVQVFGDRHGNVVHMFERDCTLQRRNQKVIEEAPAPGMTPELREKMTADAVKLAKAVGYEGAGTVEFLVEGGSLGKDAPYYFIEMNTRLQVEHPVTEEITGLDLVEWQLRIAAGEPLPATQDEIELRGHAIEARVCAEDPGRDFAPSIGEISAFETPPEGRDWDAGEANSYRRVETGFQAGSAISPFYDSLIAKLIHFGDSREEAIEGLRDDLAATRILGLKTNIAFLSALLGREDVQSGQMTTGLIGENIGDLSPMAGPAPSAIAAGVRALLLLQQARNETMPPALAGHDPWDHGDAFQLNASLQPGRDLMRPVMVDGVSRDVTLRWREGDLQVLVDGENAAWRDEEVSPWDAEVTSISDNGCARAFDGKGAFVLHNLVHTHVTWPHYDISAIDDGDGSGAIRAPINGRIARIFVTEGAEVEENAPIAVVEAMKMEHVLLSPRAGIIERLGFVEGDQVTEGAVIAALAGEDGT
ncbi:MAG TPA: acetyl/propionyl/methylcrotonyl-CoA carboxylase subunit alpha [Hyphomicrobiaceae bacterium]|nr:acetyl/propionyl/methylcrotonyl-CoA carboxylase subunit alpha [Hyphomicrobiaceae bacterium]